MEEKITYSNITIFTHNFNYAYKVRNRLSSDNIQIGCCSTITDLLDFLFYHEQGVVLIDGCSPRVQSYIVRYSTRQLRGNISFVFLNDNMNLEIDCDNKYTFISNYDRLPDTIALIKDKMVSRRNYADYIPEANANIELTKILRYFNFPLAYKGYEYIRDCVSIMLSEVGQNLSLKEVYEIVGHNQNKSCASIEKCIRKILTEACTKNPDKFLQKLNRAKVSNLEFLNYLVDTIREEYSKQLVFK